MLARRLDGANQAFLELTAQVQLGEPRSVIDKSIEKVKGLLLGASGANLGPQSENPPAQPGPRGGRAA
jgi:hypothetical protein